MKKRRPRENFNLVSESNRVINSIISNFALPRTLFSEVDISEPLTPDSDAVISAAVTTTDMIDRDLAVDISEFVNDNFSNVDVLFFDSDFEDEVDIGFVNEANLWFEIYDPKDLHESIKKPMEKNVYGISNLQLTAVLDYFDKGLDGWSWEAWESAGNIDKEEIVKYASNEFKNIDSSLLYDIFWDWASLLTAADFPKKQRRTKWIVIPKSLWGLLGNYPTLLADTYNAVLSSIAFYDDPNDSYESKIKVIFYLENNKKVVETLDLLDFIQVLDLKEGETQVYDTFNNVINRLHESIKKSQVKKSNLTERFMSIHEKPSTRFNKNLKKVYEMLDKYGTEKEDVDKVFNRATLKERLEMVKLLKEGASSIKPTNYVSNKVYKNTLMEAIDTMNGAESISEVYIAYIEWTYGWAPVCVRPDFAEVKRWYERFAAEYPGWRVVLMKFNNLTADQAKEVIFQRTRVFELEQLLTNCGVDFEILEDTSAAPVSTITKKANKAKVGYKYYYVVCMREEAFEPAEVLAAGTIKVDLSKLSGSETPEELAMTDYFDGTGIAYSDDWDDDMWDNLTRYVYEIDEDVYKTEKGLPKTDSEIIKYVEDSVADYEE